jgi:hypothetical protein
MAEGPACTPTQENVRLRGEREYFAHRGEYHNPYTIGSNEFDAYERGWMKSLKLNGGKLVNMEAQQPSAPPRRPPSSDYNGYAELKGRSKPRK